MALHYSVQLGRWVDDDEEEESTQFANDGFDMEGSNPYDEPPPVPGPMPRVPDLGGTRMPGDNTSRMRDMAFRVNEALEPPSEMDITPEAIELDNEVDAGVAELEAQERAGLPGWGDMAMPKVRTQQFRAPVLADDGDPDPEDNDMSIGAITTKRPATPADMAAGPGGAWDTTSLREAMARDSVRPVTDRAKRNLETGAGMGTTVPLEEPPEQDTWADRGPLSTPDETWAGAEAPFRKPVEVSGPMAEPQGPPGPQPAPPPDMAPPPQRDLGASKLTYEQSSKPGVTGPTSQVGVETANPDPMQARLARVRALHEQKYGSTATPVQGASAYQPYQSTGKRYSDDDMERSYIFNVIGGGASQAMAGRAQQMGYNRDQDARDAAGETQAYKRWMAEHKLREGNRPLSLAEKQQLAMTGVEPEAANEANPGAVKLASSLGGLATRERGLDVKSQQQLIAERERDLRQERDQEQKGRLAGQRSDDSRWNAGQNERLYDKKHANDEAGRADLMSAAISSLSNVSPDQADEFLATGSIRGASPEQLDDAKNAARVASRLPSERLQKFAADSARSEGSNRDKPVVSAAVKRADPDKRLKIREERDGADRAVDAALSGYETLAKRPGALELLVKIGQAGEDGKGSLLSPVNLVKRAMFEAKQANLSPEEQAAVGSIMQLMSRAAVKDHGANFSSTEQQMFGASSGVTLGQGTSIFRDPAVVKQWLRQANKARHSYRKNTETEFRLGAQ